MNHVVILAAGQGQRMKSRTDKLLEKVAGHPVVYYSLMAYNDHPDIDSIMIVANKTNKEEIKKIAKSYNFRKVYKIIEGGATRQESLGKALAELDKKAKRNDIVVVHNAANPLPSFEEVLSVIEYTKEHPGCIVAHKVSNTIKETDGEHIIKTHNRKNLFAAETPQAAQFPLLKKAYKNAEKNNIECTDEAMLLEEIGEKVMIVEASENNFKITTQADMQRLRTVLGEMPEDFRVGIGQDSHMFDEEEYGLTLGGLFLKDEQKLKAKSDGDVVLHAIFNALSQAIGDMSLGFYADPMCEKGVKDSKKYVEKVLKKVKKEKFQISHMGVMIECGEPKIDPLVKDMKKSLSKILGIDARRIGITATTGEECTVFGSGLGIQCFAIASLVKA